MSSIATWWHNLKTTELTYKSDNVLLHPGKGGMNFNVEFRTQKGIMYMIIFMNKIDGSMNDCHIFQCPGEGFFINDDTIEWSPIEIRGIENKFTKKSATRKITINDSNFFNKLIRHYKNRE